MSKPLVIKDRALLKAKQHPPQQDTRPTQAVELVNAFESDTIDMLSRTAPKRERAIAWVVVFAVFLGVVLASVFSLDRVVTGQGRIVSAAGHLYVSPLTAGVVRDIKVKVGATVHKGQVLAEMDQTFTAADLAQLKEQQVSNAAKLERLQAEHDGSVYRPSVNNEYSALEHAVYQQRQAEYRATVAAYDAEIGNAQAIVARLSQDAEQYRKRMAIASDIQGMYAPLVNKGYVSRQQYAGASDTKEEMSRLADSARNQITAQEQTLQAARSQRAAYIEKWKSDISVALVNARKDHAATSEELGKAHKMQELTSLTSPADAVVLRIAKISRGSIAQTTDITARESSGALFTLAPLDAELQAAVHVAAKDIAFVRRGDKVNIKLDGYSFLRHGTMTGAVETISEGSFNTDDLGNPVSPYFEVIIKVTGHTLRHVPDDFRLVPGTTLSADVLVGERTILSYLIEGFLRTGSEAMREPD